MMEIGVAADDGKVILTGTATTRAESLAAQDVACHVAGVHDVTNRIRVESASPSILRALAAKREAPL